MAESPRNTENPLDADPETVVQAAYLQSFRKLRRLICYVLAATIVAIGLGCWAVYTATQERTRGHEDTQQQIAQLACGVVDQIPPDHGLADQVRARYHCGPYSPPKAKVVPKPGTVPSNAPGAGR